MGAYLGDSDVIVECAVRAKPPPTTMFWIVDANGTIVSDKDDDSPNRFVVNEVCQTLLKAQYCPRVASVPSAGSNKVAPSSE